MLSDAEKKLLSSAPAGFPMIAAALAAWKRCGTCGHSKDNIRGILRVAVTMYAQDPAFIAHCKTIMPLPCMLGGVLIT